MGVLHQAAVVSGDNADDGGTEADALDDDDDDPLSAMR